MVLKKAVCTNWIADWFCSRTAMVDVEIRLLQYKQFHMFFWFFKVIGDVTNKMISFTLSFCQQFCQLCLVRQFQLKNLPNYLQFWHDAKEWLQNWMKNEFDEYSVLEIINCVFPFVQVKKTLFLALKCFPLRVFGNPCSCVLFVVWYSIAVSSANCKTL